MLKRCLRQHWNNLETLRKRDAKAREIIGKKHTAYDVAIRKWREIDCLLKEVESITEWWQGEPLVVRKDGLDQDHQTFRSSIESNNRLGDIQCYHNGRGKKRKWGVWVGSCPAHLDNHRGHNWTNRKAAVEAVKDWIATGTIPLYNGKIVKIQKQLARV